jgi:hypothetical protein
MVRSFSRQAVPVVAAIFVAGGIVQVFLAGLGVFDDPRTFLTHASFGYLLSILPLVLVILSIAGRSSRRVIGLSALLIALFLLQSVFVALRTDLPTVAALHPLNGFLILGCGVVTTRLAWAERGASVASTRDAAPASTGVADSAT